MLFALFVHLIQKKQILYTIVHKNIILLEKYTYPPLLAALLVQLINEGFGFFY